MDGTESKKIAQAWINFQQNWWAWDKLDELCRKDPKGTWQVLIDLVEVAESTELLEDIGVGPLEDFINYYAADYIDQLESIAVSSEAFSTALSYVQLRDSTHALSDRIAALGCRVSAGSDKSEDPDVPS